MSDDQRTQPALPAHAWRERFFVVQAERYGEPGMPSEGCGAAEIHVTPEALRITSHEYSTIAVIDTPEQRHALAALCLHGQPYGFTREDVKLLEATDTAYRSMPTTSAAADLASIVLADQFRSLASRITALLPPEPQ